MNWRRIICWLSGGHRGRWLHSYFIGTEARYCEMCGVQETRAVATREGRSLG